MDDYRNEKGQFKKGIVNSPEVIRKAREASLGNSFAKKLTTTELKLAAYESYLDHLARGKSKKSWYFEHPELTIIWETMEAYIAAEPEIFLPVQKQVAWAKGYQHWESVVEDSAKGINEKANTASLQMVMRNKYHWDKEESVNRDSKQTLVEKFINILDNTTAEPTV